jgi:hypothetical protein
VSKKPDLEASAAETISVADQAAAVRIDVIQALGAITQDRELFQRSADLARQVKDGTLPAEEAARQIAQDSPEVASILRRPRAAKAGELLIAVLIAAIFFIAGKVLNHSATPADVERIVAQHDRDIQGAERRDMQHEVQVAVDRALQDYYSQHPPTRATKPQPK